MLELILSKNINNFHRKNKVIKNYYLELVSLLSLFRYLL